MLQKTKDPFISEDSPTASRIPSERCRYVVHGFHREELKGSRKLVIFQLKDGGKSVKKAKEKQIQDSAVLVALLKDCAKHKNVCRGRRLHEDIRETGLPVKDIYVGNTLIHMYAKCGALAAAQEVFDEVSVRDTVSWNALIAGYAHHGHSAEALKCFEGLQNEGLSPDAFTFACVLKACGSLRSVVKGGKIHNEVGRLGLTNKDIVLGNALVDMYVKCGVLIKAQEVFEELPCRDVVSWNGLITGYVQHGHGDEALICHAQMCSEGLLPDRVTFISILKACSITRATKKGEKIHAELMRKRLLEKDIMLGNALIDMYAKCGALAKAQDVFNKLPMRDAVSWSILIAGHVHHGNNDEALYCFKQMRDDGLFPDAVTFLCILKACGNVGSVAGGEDVHNEVARCGLLANNSLVGTAVLDMYVKCGLLSKALIVFDELPVRDIVSWTVLIAGYVESGLSEEALRYFRWMRNEGLSPNVVTLVYILRACGTIGAYGNGEKMHIQIASQGLLGRNVVVGTALVDMYVKCGLLVKAQEVFAELSVRSTVSWNALMAGHAQHGEAENVFSMINKMLGEAVELDVLIFNVLFTVCSHAGLLNEGCRCFQTMGIVHNVAPSVEHQTCMVDLFSRAGDFDKALSIIDKVSPSDCLPLWSTVLGGCQKWGNVELGSWAFQHAVELDSEYTGAYSCMRNVYVTVAMQIAWKL